LRSADGRSVVEFPGYRPPAWLTAPDPGLATPIDDRARLWSPPGTDARRAAAAAGGARRLRLRRRARVTRAFPPHERERFVAHYRGLLAAWVRDQP
jgi:hypothetical protein